MLLYLVEQETGQTAAMSAVDSAPSSRNTPRCLYGVGLSLLSLVVSNLTVYSQSG